MEVWMNWLKKTLGICALSISLIFGSTSISKAQTLEIVFKSSLWGSAIGGVSGLAFWALQEEDKEDKLFPKYVVKGLALGLFVGMGFGIYDAQTGGDIFMSENKINGFFHYDLKSNVLAIRPAKILPSPEWDTNSLHWRFDVLTGTF